MNETFTIHLIIQCSSSLLGWNTMGKISCWSWHWCEHCSCPNLCIWGNAIVQNWSLTKRFY